jgi:hypothetical protein
VTDHLTFRPLTWLLHRDYIFFITTAEAGNGGDFVGSWFVAGSSDTYPSGSGVAFRSGGDIAADAWETFPDLYFRAVFSFGSNPPRCDPTRGFEDILPFNPTCVSAVSSSQSPSSNPKFAPPGLCQECELQNGFDKSVAAFLPTDSSCTVRLRASLLLYVLYSSSQPRVAAGLPLW